MKKEVVSLFCVFALLGGTTAAFAGAYGEPQQPEELPASPPPAAAIEEAQVVTEAPVLREFAGFLTDAETSRGLWVELGSVYASETNNGPFGDLDFVNTFLHLSYGQKLWEVGALLPYGYVHEDGFGSDNGFADVSVWGKVIPVRTDLFQLGGGLVASFPTGDNAFSSDEYSVEPFVTGAVAAGPVSLRGSFGYTFWTNMSDTLDAEVAALMPIGDAVALRAELLYQHDLSDRFDWDPITLAPGVDIRCPLGGNGWELLVRPTGGVGLNEDAPNWQVGLSLALTQA